MTNPTDIDGDLIRKLASLLDETNLTEIDYAIGELRVRVNRAPTPVQAYAPGPGPSAAAPATPAPAAQGPAVEDWQNHPGAVKSPMVGTCYLSPNPGSPPFIRVGDTVSVGQTVLIIEAMKVMNQIRAAKGGKVARILVEDSHPVEYGQVVVVLE
jgi:acetyl-CoA carboxylase biotin carboxyl carrier protein